MKEQLSDELADYYLDRDPTSMPDVAAAESRALLVLDMDPDNMKARCFLLRLNTYQVGELSKSRAQNFSQLYERLSNLRRHAEWLEARLPAFSAERQAQVKGDLAGYYEQMGEIKHSEGQKATGEINNATTHFERAVTELESGLVVSRESARGRIVSALRDRQRALEQARESYRVSDEAFEKSLRFERVNPAATERIARHRSECATIATMLDQTRDVLRQLREY